MRRTPTARTTGKARIQHPRRTRSARQKADRQMGSAACSNRAGFGGPGEK